jgi:hypothetical protein
MVLDLSLVPTLFRLTLIRTTLMLLPSLLARVRVSSPGGLVSFLPSFQGSSGSAPARATVLANPVAGRPVVAVRALPGWFEVTVRGAAGEGGLFHVPMLPLPSDLSGLLTVDFVSATAGVLAGRVPRLLGWGHPLSGLDVALLGPAVLGLPAPLGGPVPVRAQLADPAPVEAAHDFSDGDLPG